MDFQSRLSHQWKNWRNYPDLVRVMESQFRENPAPLPGFMTRVATGVGMAECFYWTGDMSEAVRQRTLAMTKTEQPVVCKIDSYNGDDWRLHYFELPLVIAVADGRKLYIQGILEITFDPGPKPVQVKRAKGEDVVIDRVSRGTLALFRMEHGPTPIPMLVPFMVDGDEVADVADQYCQSVGNQSYEGFLSIEGMTAVVAATMCFSVVSRQLLEERLHVEPAAMDRNAVRQARREGRRSDVQVVYWRKKEYARDPNHDTKDVDWSCHWSVRSHNRRLRDGRVIKVSGHIKGDITKPYREPTALLNVVKE